MVATPSATATWRFIMHDNIPETVVAALESAAPGTQIEGYTHAARASVEYPCGWECCGWYQTVLTLLTPDGEEIEIVV